MEEEGLVWGSFGFPCPPALNAAAVTAELSGHLVARVGNCCGPFGISPLEAAGLAGADSPHRGEKARTLPWGGDAQASPQRPHVCAIPLLQKITDNIKGKVCSMAVCAVAWLVAHVRMLGLDEREKSLQMIRQLATPLYGENTLQFYNER